MPLGSPQALPDVPEQALPRADALALAQGLLDEGRAFAAHEVLEASWKAAPTGERALWQGLAQVCVGATHLQRGNLVGAVRLLQRGAGQLDVAAALDVDADVAGSAHVDVDVAGVRAWALGLAAAVADGSVGGGAVYAPARGPGGPLWLRLGPA